MPERHQADITDQKIEGADKQRKAQHLHQKHRIGDKRRHREQRYHDGEADDETHIRLAATLKDQRIDNALHHAVRPNIPAGRTNSTMTMMTKITVFEASGKKTLVQP